MKKIIDNKHYTLAHRLIKDLFIFVVGVSLIYSFLYLPIQERMLRSACSSGATEQVQVASQQVVEYNKNLEEGQQPLVIDEIALYSAQYTLCVQSKGF